MLRFRLLALLFPLFVAGASAQKFYPDDPIDRDLDNLTIEKPKFVDLSPTYDLAENTFGSQAEKTLRRAQNVNTLGEVPDSSWFTNRIGTQVMSIEELVRGGDLTGGPDTSRPLKVVGSSLTAVTEGLVVEDGRGDRYYLIFDRKGYPNLATAAGMISSKFFYAFGYHTFPVSLVSVDIDAFELDPAAEVRTLGGKMLPLDQEFIDLYKEEIEPPRDGLYRALAALVPEGELLGPFKFYGIRPDDPNDIFPHENRRELRGLRVFSAWLNHYLCHSVKTRDGYVTEGGDSYVKHFLVDFTTTLGCGYDLDDRIVAKDQQVGNEYTLPGDGGAILKTALTLGIWERPWMQADFPYPELAEIGRIEGDFFDPDKWKPFYPNAAFDRMFADDAFWAAKIVAQFSDDAIRAIVKTGQFSDSRAEDYLVDVLIKRRDKIVNYYFRQLNPLDSFEVVRSELNFRNLGEEWGIGQINNYDYQWYTFDNQREERTPLGGVNYTRKRSIPIPVSSAEYLVVRMRTRSQQARNWKKNIEVFLRDEGSSWKVVGIDREVGIPALDLLGRQTGELAASIEFGGLFESLEAEQQNLIRDWVERFNSATNRQLKPDELYNELPMSYRTTFEAATNALLETPLTDEQGNQFAIAFDIIARLQAIHGKIEGAGGDEQFRIYIELKADAVEMLDKSREFARGADNTVYHKGYPINYRHQVAPPSMQVSISEDQKNADVDVDYRSSKFPKALLNGHLTAANSDVRAGNNHELHSNRWEGLQNWWRGLFGLPLIGTLYDPDQKSEFVIPMEPRKGTGELEEAAADFLKAWLVDQKPQEAIAYVSKQAIPCMAPQEGTEQLDLTMAPFLMLERMRTLNQAIGEINELGDVAVGVRLPEPRLRVIEQPYHRQFVLYDVPEDLALKFQCGREDDPEALAMKDAGQNYGKYFGSVFRLTTPKGEGGTMTLLWAKEGKFWKILSYEVSDEIREAAALPDLRPAVPTTVAERVAGDPGFVAANKRLLETWLVDHDYDTALSMFSSECNRCVGLYLPDEEEKPATDEEARARLRVGLERMGALFKAAERPRDIVEPVEPAHPDVKVITHEEEDVFTLISAPDYMGEGAGCSQRLEAGQKWDESETKVYGNYMGTLFELKLVGGEPAVFLLVWKKEGGDWKVIAYHILTP